MDYLFQFYLKNTSLTPPEALRQLVGEWAQGNHSRGGNAGLNPTYNHQQNAGQRTPNPTGVFPPGGPQQQFNNSPAPGNHLTIAGNNPSANNMNMSPAAFQQQQAQQQAQLQGGNMAQAQPAGVAMVAQASQQGSASVGTGSQGTSANTSPHVTNKKRRASQVKVEMEAEGDAANANKVKASPRVGGKRQKP